MSTLDQNIPSMRELMALFPGVADNIRALNGQIEQLDGTIGTL